MQMAVPDRLRGRVMGFYGMTYNIRPLGGMQAGALASLITTPLAVAVGGLALAGFTIAALLSRKVRNLNGNMREAEAAVETEQISAPSVPAVNN